jgi:hypothetical protein|tara:strand:- start:243 stop:653 length:411 start_codon:yes stop_codon:yes gene_type:complete
MPLTFESKSITKTVSIDDLPKLSRAEIELLRNELEKAVLDMDTSLADITYEKHQDGLEPNKNWLHAIKKKQTICETFLQTIKDQLKLNNSQFIQKKYNKILQNLLIEALGEDQLKAIEQKAKNLTFEGMIDSQGNT